LLMRPEASGLLGLVGTVVGGLAGIFLVPRTPELSVLAPEARGLAAEVASLLAREASQPTPEPTPPPPSYVNLTCPAPGPPAPCVCQVLEAAQESAGAVERAAVGGFGPLVGHILLVLGGRVVARYNRDGNGVGERDPPGAAAVGERPGPRGRGVLE
jgi:hypothetical protein